MQEFRGYKDAVLRISDQDSFTHEGTILIFPGGGYRRLSDREGDVIIRAFGSRGYRGAVLEYDVSREILGLVPLKQAAWAAAKLRELYPDEPLVVCGFSAGAHLAGSLSIHHDDTDWNGDPLFNEVTELLGTESPQFRPDGMILAYPVVTGGVYAHRGSFDRLLGSRDAYKEKYGDTDGYDRALNWFSLEKQVHESTPPGFIWQTETDNSVPVQNSLMLVSAMAEQGIPVEYHLYPEGVHGMSLATKEVEELGKNRIADPHIADWFNRCADWLQDVLIPKFH